MSTAPTYFYKSFDPAQENMAYIEAANNALYRFLVPNVVTCSHSILQDNGEEKPSIDVISKAIPEFKSFRSDPLTAADLNDPLFVKRLAEMLVSSYLFEEEDLHIGNIGKKGRIDYDMSFWSIVWRFKGNRATDLHGYWRDPTQAFPITEQDIRNFPLLSDNLCEYWPTKTSLVANNAFSKEQNALFASLRDHPDFIAHKFSILLQFLITMTPELMRSIVSQHIPPEVSVLRPPCKTREKLIDVYAEWAEKKVDNLRQVLTGMPEFETFLKDKGEQTYSKIEKDINTHNAKMQTKVSKGKTHYQASCINLSMMREKYRQIYHQSTQNALAVDDFDEIFGSGTNNTLRG